jgi:hypothetical protein
VVGKKPWFAGSPTHGGGEGLKFGFGKGQASVFLFCSCGMGVVGWEGHFVICVVTLFLCSEKVKYAFIRSLYLSPSDILYLFILM